MLAKQYTIKLPADYDMEIIRDRVRAGGPRFDHTDGLAFKAFLITEGHTNSYAPFYVWNDTRGANDFLYGPGFKGLETSFGRPRIEHWIGLGLVTGDATSARSATREDIVIHDTDDLAGVRRREQAWLDALDPRALAVATVALELSKTGTPPEIHFGWSGESPLAANLGFLLFGEGNVPWLVRELILKAEPDPAKQPRVIIG